MQIITFFMVIIILKHFVNISQLTMQQRGNYWDVFKLIPINQRSKHLQQILTLPQLKNKIQIPRHQYPEDIYIQTAGVKHHAYIWPKNKYTGVLFMMHGMDSHAVSSGTLAKYITENTNLIVIAADFRNHGKSIHDEHGYIQSVDILIKDSENIIDAIIKKYQPSKLFLAGVSMGGGIAFRMAINRPSLYDGIIMLAPALRSNYENSPFLKKVGKVIGWMFPRWKFMDSTSGSGTRHECFNSCDDPLNYNGKIIPGSVRAILEFMQQNQTLLDKLETPYLMFMGGSDKLVDPFVAVDLDAKCKSKDKTTFMVKDMWHCIPLEPQFIKEVLPLMAKWINNRSI